MGRHHADIGALQYRAWSAYAQSTSTPDEVVDAHDGLPFRPADVFAAGFSVAASEAAARCVAILGEHGDGAEAARAIAEEFGLTAGPKHRRRLLGLGAAA